MPSLSHRSVEFLGVFRRKEKRSEACLPRLHSRQSLNGEIAEWKKAIYRNPRQNKRCAFRWDESEKRSPLRPGQKIIN